MSNQTYSLRNHWCALFCATALLSLVVCPGAALAVDGISNTKVVGPSTDTVPPGLFEFEPAYDFGFATRGLNNSGRSFSLNGRHSSQSFGARLTAGVLENLEAGVTIAIEHEEDATLFPPESDTGIADLGAGFKFRFWEPSDLVHVALQGGLTFPTSSRGSALLGEIGLISTFYLSEKFSIDADLVLGRSTAGKTEIDNPRWTFGWDVAAGYQVTDALTLVTELNALHASPVTKEPNTREYQLTPGLTWAPSESILVITGASFMLPQLSKNTDRSITYLLAITFALGEEKS